MVLAAFAKIADCNSYMDLENKFHNPNFNWGKIIEQLVEIYWPLRKVAKLRTKAQDLAEAAWKRMLSEVPSGERNAEQQNKLRWPKRINLEYRDIAYENMCAFLRDGTIEWMFDQDIRRGDTGALLLEMEILAEIGRAHV